MTYEIKKRTDELLEELKLEHGIKMMELKVMKLIS